MTTVRLDVIFFRTESGFEPVRDWLKRLSKTDKKAIGASMKTVQFGWPIGMPLVNSVDRGLWEVRIRLSNTRIARILFFMDSHSMVLVNGFIKKTQKTQKMPKQELALAKRRKKLYEQFGDMRKG